MAPITKFIVVLVTLGLGGCSLFVTATPDTPQDKAIREVNTAQDAYFIALAVVNSQYTKGRISEKTMREIIVPLEETAWDYLSAASLAAQNGDVVEAAKQSQLFRDALRRFLTAGNPVPVPATQPEKSPGE